KRTDPPIFKLRLHHHDSTNNDPPNSDSELFMLEALTGYKSVSFTDQGQLPHGYYFDDINSSLITVNFTSQPAPLEVKINFEVAGATEMPTTSSLFSNMNFIKEFYISVNFTLGWDVAN